MRKTMRIDKVLGNSGLGTRKEVKELIKTGRIKVNGTTVDDPGFHVDPESDRIDIDGEKLKYRKYIYLMLNKPQGVISATTDNRHKTVLDIIPENYKNFSLSPVGRLDIDTEGLLLLTNDGPSTHELLSPVKHVEKTYFAILDRDADDADIDKFLEGVTLDDGYKTMPARLQIEEDRRRVLITIKEGKFHQVKRMFDAVEKKVVFLKRIRMGNLILDEKLLPGQCRELYDNEIEDLLNFIDDNRSRKINE